MLVWDSSVMGSRLHKAEVAWLTRGLEAVVAVEAQLSGAKEILGMTGKL